MDKASAQSKDSDKVRAGIQSVEVGFALLNVLAQAPGSLMLRDLAAAAQMSAAKAHRYLVSFQRLGLVAQDSVNTRYELGPATLRLGLATLSRIDAVKMARDRLPAMIDASGHTMALAVWGNRGPTLVHWQETSPATPVRLRLGDVMPLLSSATGRCFGAFSSQGASADQVAAMIEAELPQLRQLGRDDLPSTPEQVQTLLKETRLQGLGRVVDVLLPGISGLCAPVFDADGHMVLGVVSLGSTATLDTAWDGPPAQSLRHFAQQLSADLGWQRPTGEPRVGPP